jgi:hypothetical protein
MGVGRYADRGSTPRLSTMKNCPKYESMTLEQIEIEITKLPLRGFDRLKLMLEISIKLSKARPAEKLFTSLICACAYAALRDSGKLP